MKSSKKSVKQAGASAEESVLQDREGRRQLRKQQNELHNELLAHKDELEEAKSDKFEHFRHRLNQLFDQTKHARESLNDAINMKELAKAVKTQTAHLEDVSRRYDFNDYVDGLRSQFRTGERGGEFSWEMFGRSVRVVFHSVPTFETMYGPIAKEVKERKQVVRQRKEALGEAAEPDVIKNAETENETSEATNERVIKLYQQISNPPDIITSTSSSTQGNVAKTINMLDLLVDRKDRIQTIENFFDFSFLCKDKRVMEQLNPVDHLPNLIAVDPAVMAERFQNQSRQMVLSIPMHELATVTNLLTDIDKLLVDKNPQMARKFNPDGLLHRDDELYLTQDVHAQTEIIQKMAQSKWLPQSKSRRISVDQEDSQSQSTKKSPAGKKRGKVSSQSQDSEDEDEVDETPQKRNGRGKRKKL